MTEDRPALGTFAGTQPMHEDPSSSAALVAHWRELRAGTPITGSADITLGLLGVAATGVVGTVTPQLTDPATGRHYVLNAEPGAIALTGAPAGLSVTPPEPPELMLGVSLIVPGHETNEGVIILAVAPVWRRCLNELASSPEVFSRLDPRQMEELVAGAYSEDGWEVTLTPRSGDRGRDVIACRDDIGAIRVLDQVKRYAAGHVVDADEVRAMFGVLNLDLKASKAVITTTSRFAPGVSAEFATVMPTRLELRDGNQLRAWLKRFSER